MLLFSLGFAYLEVNWILNCSFEGLRQDFGHLFYEFVDVWTGQLPPVVTPREYLAVFQLVKKANIVFS